MALSTATLWLVSCSSCVHASKYRPWRVVFTIEFACAQRAAAFETYLKSGSEAAFLKRHLL